VSIGYWSAILLEQMLKATLKKVGGNPNLVTGTALQKMVNAGFTYTDPIPGGIDTEYFPAPEQVPNGCSTLLQTVGAGFKAVTPYQCLGDVNVVKDKKVNIKTGKLIPLGRSQTSPRDRGEGDGALLRSSLAGHRMPALPRRILEGPASHS
jgi:hypothetical protein